jgi:hypothetical protein
MEMAENCCPNEEKLPQLKRKRAAARAKRVPGANSLALPRHPSQKRKQHR